MDGTSQRISQRIAEVYRASSGRVLARLIRVFGGDFQLAEEGLHDAFEAALVQWAEGGMPDEPGAWILRTARNKATDRLRRRTRLASMLAENPIEPPGGSVAPSPDEQRNTDRRERTQHEPPVVQSDLHGASGRRLHVDASDD